MSRKAISVLLTALACAVFRRRKSHSPLREIVAGTVLLASSLHGAVWLNEFVAENSGGLTNAAGETSDWIELYNDATNAVDIGGWYLTDKADSPTKWRFPDGTSIASNGYLVVFADSASVSSTNGELHANFSLSKNGEYLGLVCADGVTVADAFAPEYPQQYEDISYGRSPHECEYVGEGTPARYRIPDADGTSPWCEGTGTLGFASTNAAFTVRYYEMTGTIANVNTAELMVANSAYWKTDKAYPITGQYPWIDFHGTSTSGYFTNNVLFPGHTAVNQDKNYFVVVADTSIIVPKAGQWTFAVGSDDGFRLRISGHGVSFVSEYVSGRSFGTTLSTFTFPVAGVYTLNLVYYENTVGASVEFSAAQGYQSAFSLDAFALVGDSASLLQHEGTIGAIVETAPSPSRSSAKTRPTLSSATRWTATRREPIRRCTPTP